MINLALAFPVVASRPVLLPSPLPSFLSFSPFLFIIHLLPNCPFQSRISAAHQFQVLHLFSVSLIDKIKQQTSRQWLEHANVEPKSLKRRSCRACPRTVRRKRSEFFFSFIYLFPPLTLACVCYSSFLCHLMMLLLSPSCFVSLVLCTIPSTLSFFLQWGA
jgi:hypothetical protein